LLLRQATQPHPVQLALQVQLAPPVQLALPVQLELQVQLAPQVQLVQLVRNKQSAIHPQNAPYGAFSFSMSAFIQSASDRLPNYAATVANCQRCLAIKL
jgi:hypothetical protein